MKRTYIHPQTRALAYQHETPIAASVTSGNGIGYGGVDTDGSLDPDVKENTFDFEWE